MIFQFRVNYELAIFWKLHLENVTLYVLFLTIILATYVRYVIHPLPLGEATPEDGRGPSYTLYGLDFFFHAHFTSFHFTYFISTLFLFLTSFSVSLCYFILAVPMRECVGKHSLIIS